MANGWDIEDYAINPRELYAKHTESEIHAEYTRLRDIMNKRLSRLEKYYPESKYIAKWEQGIPKLADYKRMKNQAEARADLAYNLRMLAKDVASKMTTVRGQQRFEKQSIGTLHEHGYDFVTRENFRDFYEYMNEMRAIAGSMAYDSEQFAEFFGDMTKLAEKREMSVSAVREDFGKWLNEKRESAKTPKTAEKYSAADGSELRKLFKQYKRQTGKRGKK